LAKAVCVAINYLCQKNYFARRKAKRSRARVCECLRIYSKKPCATEHYHVIVACITQRYCEGCAACSEDRLPRARRAVAISDAQSQRRSTWTVDVEVPPPALVALDVELVPAGSCRSSRVDVEVPSPALVALDVGLVSAESCRSCRVFCAASVFTTTTMVRQTMATPATTPPTMIAVLGAVEGQVNTGIGSHSGACLAYVQSG